MVDDEPVVLDILSDVLVREGFDVRLASRADAALAQLEQAAFDLVLSDIRMPGMDGFELLRRIGSAHPGTDVILMTGYASVDGAIDAMQLGAADYLIKPLKPKEIVARIHTYGHVNRRLLPLQVATGDAIEVQTPLCDEDGDEVGRLMSSCPVPGCDWSLAIGILPNALLELGGELHVATADGPLAELIALREA